jgi:DNA-binding NarL/FixJ family response regulator
MSSSPTLLHGPGRATRDGAARILVVEDHNLVGQGLEAALRSSGFAVELATGPTIEAILEVARARPPEVALVDLHLSGEQDGRDLIAPLAALGATVIVVTGETDRFELAACIEAGAAGVASKKESMSFVIDKVRRALRGEAVTATGEREELLSLLRDHRRSERSRLLPFAHLTRREQAVLAAVMDGRSAEAIAHESFVSVTTVRTQIRSTLQKLGVGSQLAAVALARQAGWRPD